MIIEIKNENKLSFSDVDSGSVFRLGEAVYLKLANSVKPYYRDGSVGSLYNAVNLGNGGLAYISGNDSVELVEGKFVGKVV